MDVASTQDFAAAGGKVYPVVRTTGKIPINAAQALTPDVLGVDPAALPLIHAWDDVVGASDPFSAGRILGAGSGADVAKLTGVPVPQGTTNLVFPATGNVDDLDIAAWIRLADGRDTGGELEHVGSDLVVNLPLPVPAGAVLFALTISEDEFSLTRRLHRTGKQAVESVEELISEHGISPARGTTMPGHSPAGSPWALPPAAAGPAGAPTTPPLPPGRIGSPWTTS